MPTSDKSQNSLIIISDQEHSLPYSKGLMASSIMATGLSPDKAYAVAKQVEAVLLEKGRRHVTMQQLRKIVRSVLRQAAGREYASRYQRWQALSKLDKPMVILIGGTTGVGKSTVAAEIGHRLGITRIVSSDAIREVMRTIFSKQLMPALYNSSFDAWLGLRVPVPKQADPIIIGFREQASVVATGVKAIIERSITEGVNQIIEGVHVFQDLLIIILLLGRLLSCR